MHGLTPIVHAKVNGVDASFIADSGAYFSTIAPAAASEFKLRLEPLPPDYLVTGVGGDAQASLTTVKTFAFSDMSISDVQFLVTGNDIGGGAVGLLGQNVFRIADVEYDLANGAIRLIRPEECKKAQVAYWVTSQPVSVMDIGWANADSPHTSGVADLNGRKIRVMFDTGAPRSMLTLEAAKHAGFKPDGEGVVNGGAVAGVGRRLIQTWIARFQSFKIGDEELHDVRLLVSDARMLRVDMLIGADYFLSHRIYVASSQHKLYFTYNGGPVFSLPQMASNSTPAPIPAGEAAPPAVSAPDDAATQPADAAGFSRRGTAFAARRDFEHAITDLTRACELAPNEPSYFYQRGMAHWENKQPALAMADFDLALKLKPGDFSTLVARAELHMRYRDNAAGIADLNAADRSAPKEADVRMRMADLYMHAGEFAAAVSQYSLWIGVRDRNDVLMPQAMNARCRARALWGRELEQALADCNTALKLTPDNAAFLDSRGLVQLRRGDYDKAITDYDRGTRLQPKSAWPQYGRGVAKLRKGLTADGEADIAAATALQPNIADEAKKYGIIP